MRRVAKFVLAGLLGATFWWLVLSLTSPTGFWVDFDWPSETGGLTSKFVMQLLTFAVLSVPGITLGCLILHKMETGFRSMKKDNR